MKKLYSLVLMATALLIGTNAWANYDPSWLQDQFDAVQAGGQVPTTITMEDDIILLEPVYLGTATVDEARKSIILDMNGHSITMDADTWLASHPGVYCHMFTITHGELLVRNSDKTKTSLIQMTGTGHGNYNDIFTVAGSYKSSRWEKSGNDYVINESAAKNTRNEGWFTHLEIGEGVKLVAANTIAGAGISMDGLYTNNRALVSPDGTTNSVFGGPKSAGALTAASSAANVCLYNRDEDAPAYNTAIVNPVETGNAEGFAYGLRVDVYGDIEFATGATSGKSYGIKLNGGLKSSLTPTDIFLNRNCWYVDEAYAKTYGATAAPVAKQGNTPAQNQTCSIVDPYYTNHKLDTIDAPFLYIHSSAHITAASNLNAATAVYCSGYGKTLIEGECKGNSGVNIKSGTVELHDAVITGTALSYDPALAGNHATGSGGIIVNSVANRAGGIEVVISGDTKVSTTVGYAIEETVNKTGGSDVSSIAIQGGTIEGGDKGAIALTTDGEAATAVTGGNINGTASVDGTTVDVSTLVPNTSQYHTTEVTVDGKTTIVVSQGPAPSAQNTGDWETISAKTGQNVVWNEIEDASIAENATVTLGELQIIPASAGQTLTIANKATLKVNHLIMNDYARIIVEAGGKLIVEGEQGIVAPKVDNIVLKASETDQAVFLFNPAVTSNRHPNATVEFKSKSYTEGSDYAKQIFGIPTHTKLTEITAKYNNAEVATGFEYFDYSASAWKTAGYIHMAGQTIDYDKIGAPFTYYRMQHNTPNAGTIVTMKGELTGNTNAQLSALANFWCGYANSYMAPIDGQILINSITLGTVDKAYYLYYVDEETNQWGWWEQSLLEHTNINPMQPFLLRNPNEAANVTINYEAAVYNPATATLAAAPARRAVASDITKAKLIARGEGNVDRVIVAEGEQFSADFDNGYDVVKYMEQGIKLYVTADEKMGIFATDNLENTYLGFKTINGGSYSIEFANVEGAELTLIDHETGARVEIAEGTTYEFNADANTENDYRFEIVGRQNMPTSIDNTEAVKSAKGVYTITGQYVGEMNVWNTLPAGVYVVNGEKRVK